MHIKNITAIGSCFYEMNYSLLTYQPCNFNNNGVSNCADSTGGILYTHLKLLLECYLFFYLVNSYEFVTEDITYIFVDIQIIQFCINYLPSYYHYHQQTEFVPISLFFIPENRKNYYPLCCGTKSTGVIGNGRILVLFCFITI